ncbi:inositol monophosphatase [Lineolata rhizophorae]|uniref:Inositol-1-monophosphatase n=1 Tax=Lineolata rhizophorae TaxID=578093 RepID=A0A6A6NUL1_9PEZI|nr:inositol monophosphatase [Lineolata rhizophorae]
MSGPLRPIYTRMNEAEANASQMSSPTGTVMDAFEPTYDFHEIRDTLVSVAQVAGDMMRAADPSVREDSDTKRNSADRVTECDKAVEMMVLDRLTTKYPSFDFLGEETSKAGQTLGDGPTFVCDPIDGTLNFIHGFPNCAVSLALAIERKPVVGVVFNPFRRELYSAIRGFGATVEYADGSVHSLPTSGPEPPALSRGLNGCLVALEWGSERQGPNWELRTGMAIKLLSAQATGGAMCHSVRSSGSAALDLCYVAAGTIDAFWEGGCWAWDVAAGWLIVEEAGGLMASANPGDWDPTVEGRLYLAVRGASGGREEVVEEIWRHMGERKFVFGKKHASKS